MLLLTPELYEDSNEVRVSFQASTSEYSTVVQKSSLSFTLTLSMGELSTSSVTCESVHSETGIALSPCTLSVPTDWFSRFTQRGFVTLSMLYSNEEVAQQSASFTLQPIVEIPVLTSAGVLVSGKRSPVTENYVSYDVYIHTEGRSLDTWILQFAFDTSFLQYDSQSTGDLWLEASPLYDDMEIINSNGILELQSRAS